MDHRGKYETIALPSGLKRLSHVAATSH